MEPIEKRTEELAALLRESPEYLELEQARRTAFSNEATRTLLSDYRRLQTRLSAAELSGSASEDELARLQRLGELLQLDPAASAYLFAQYRLDALLAGVYKRLARAVDADLSTIDE